MKEHGVVINISGDIAKIRINQKPECLKCGLCTTSETGFRILEVKTDRPLEINQKVTLDINHKVLTISSILLYGLPLSGFMAGAIVGYVIGKEILAIVFALGFCVIDLIFAKMIIRKMQIMQNIAKIIKEG